MRRRTGEEEVVVGGDAGGGFARRRQWEGRAVLGGSGRQQSEGGEVASLT